MKILITGGHITPAIAVMEELQKEKNIDLVVVGRQFQPDSTNPSYEYQSVSKLNVPFINLEAGRLSRTLSIRTLINLAKFIPGVIKSYFILGEEKPDRILTFGGYIGLSVALAGKLRYIPIYTHEQTIIPGLTNMLISRFAQKVFVTFPESQKYFKTKTYLTGNPLRKSIFNSDKKLFDIPNDKPVLYVTGGSLGSHSINIKIEEILPELSKSYFIIHQVGDVKEFNDYERLSKLASDNYKVVKHVLDSEVGYVYSKSDIFISRAGANTVLEIIALKKPSILVPLPWSANGEQQAHAELLKEHGVAHVHNQNEPSSELLKAIHETVESLSGYKEKFSTLNAYYKSNAAQLIAHETTS